METPEPQQNIRNALQSYDMRPDVQAVLMFTSRVDCWMCGERGGRVVRASLVVYVQFRWRGGRRSAAWLGLSGNPGVLPLHLQAAAGHLEKVEAKSGVGER